MKQHGHPDKDHPRKRRTSLLQKESADFEVCRPVASVCNVVARHRQEALLLSKMSQDYFKAKERQRDPLNCTRTSTLHPSVSEKGPLVYSQGSAKGGAGEGLAATFRRLKKESKVTQDHRLTFESVFGRFSSENPEFFVRKIPEVVALLFHPVSLKAPSFFKYLSMRYPPSYEDSGASRSASFDRSPADHPFRVTPHNEIVYREFVKFVIANFPREAEADQSHSALVPPSYSRLDEFMGSVVDGERINFESPKIPFEVSSGEPKKFSVAFSKSGHISQASLLNKSSTSFHRKKQTMKESFASSLSRKDVGWSVYESKSRLKAATETPKALAAKSQKLLENKRVRDEAYRSPAKGPNDQKIDLRKSRVSTMAKELYLPKEDGSPKRTAAENQAKTLFEKHETNQKIVGLMEKALRAQYVTGERIPGMR